ncbi:MAG: fumarate hydratase [Armatimonadetes bacterium]|nr:fumarate hydratase [Armatimonadota bacterium]
MREAQARRTAVAVAGSGFYGAVEETAKALYIRALKDVPPDVRAALDKAYAEERHQVARQILGIVMRTVEIADERRTLVCQDTGTPIYWVSLGTRLHVDGARLADALRRGTERATREHPLRSSVCHPITRENPQTNTGFRIPVIHWEFLPDADHVELLCIPKGSGSENMTFLKMLTPADGVAGIKRFILECVVEAGANPCPPCIVGVGIGGSADACMVLAKKAAVRPIGTRNPDPHLAAMEEELLPAINALGIGPQGIGGDSTALAVHIEHAYTHITQNPVAVNMQCWRGLRAHARVYADGRAEIGV